MSSSVASAESRSICSRSLSASPVTRAPRSSGRFDNLLSLSRSRSSASPGKEAEEPRQVPALLGSRDDGVEVSEAKVLLREPEVVGQLLLRRLLHDPGPGERDQRAGFRDRDVAEPGALLSFTGPRVVQQTTREKLPDDFGLAESNYRFGHLDAIVPRDELKAFVAKFLRVFGNGE